MDNLFFCCSSRLHDFLNALGIVYIKNDINPNSKHEYWVYKRDEILFKTFDKWEEIKKEFELNTR